MQPKYAKPDIILENVNTTKNRIALTIKVLDECGELTRKEISEYTGINFNTLSSTLKALKIIDAIRYDDKTYKYSLTSFGNTIADNLKNNDIHNLRKQGEYVMERFPSLSFINNVYDDVKPGRGKTTKLGRMLSNYFGLGWGDRKSRTTVKGLLGILEFFRLKDRQYKGGVGKKYNIDKSKKLIPSATKKQIIDLLRIFGKDEKFTLEDAIEKSGKSKSTMQSIFADAHNLGIIDKINGHNRISDLGINVKNDIGKKINRSFGQAIQSYKPMTSFLDAIEKNQFTATKLGEMLEVYNEANWSDRTKRQYGQRLASWLEYGGRARHGKKNTFILLEPEEYHEDKTPHTQSKISIQEKQMLSEDDLNKIILELVRIGNIKSNNEKSGLIDNHIKKIHGYIDNIKKSDDINLNTNLDLLRENINDVMHKSDNSLWRLTKLVDRIREIENGHGDI